MKCLVALSLAISIGNVAAASAASERNLAALSHAQQATSGITEFPLPAPHSGPMGLTVGPDGNLWFTEYNGDRIGKITPLGVITEYGLPPFHHHPGPKRQFPTWIVTGPDGALWMSLKCGVGRFDVNSGTLTNCYAAYPADLIIGPDGNVWFLGGETYQTGIVGRVTMAGDMTLFDVPPNSQNFAGLTIGPDGNIWFASYGGFQNTDHINVLSTSGILLNSYSLPQLSDVTGLVTGPDGAVWMTAPSFLGRVSQGITQYPARGVLFGAIVAGPKRSLWFAMPDGIGESDVRGHVATHRLPQRKALPQTLVLGPDGAIWFVESRGNAVGRLQI